MSKIPLLTLIACLLVVSLVCLSSGSAVVQGGATVESDVIQKKQTSISLSMKKPDGGNFAFSDQSDYFMSNCSIRLNCYLDRNVTFKIFVNGENRANGSFVHFHLSHVQLVNGERNTIKIFVHNSTYIFHRLVHDSSSSDGWSPPSKQDKKMIDPFQFQLLQIKIFLTTFLVTVISGLVIGKIIKVRKESKPKEAL